MNKNLAIQIAGLGKQYRIGALQARERTLVETLSDSINRPWKIARSVLRRENPAHADQETFWALKGITFDVARGEVVGIIGRNGAGKSTLLKILTRITNPTEGTVRLRGRVGSLLEVGTGFHPELTGRENMYLNGAILGMRREEVDRKFDEIVAFSGVEKFIDTPVKHYSSGMYLRLAFAVAAHLEPDILLVDEVLAVGDAEFQKKCLGKMSDVAGEGRTVLLVSHNMAAIQSLCDRVIVLEGGQIVNIGPAEDAIAFYLSNYTASHSSIPIHDRQDRQGSQDSFRFKSIRFLDGNSGQPLEMLLSGQTVEIEIGYCNVGDNPLGPVHVSIGFFSEIGQFMFACNNEAIRSTLENMGNRGTLTFTISRWPLVSGLYSYNLYSKVGPVVTDWIKNAGQILVETGDYYGTGRTPSSHHKGILIDYDYRLQAE